MAPLPESEMLDGSPNDRRLSVNEDTSGFHAKYVLKEVLGKGACSIVKRCVEKATNREFAVKIVDLTTEVASEADATETYNATKNEIAILRLLSGHPNITELHNVYESSTFIFLVIELCRKGELFDHMNQVVTFSEKKTRVIMRQLLQVVEFMHSKNVVHRDLKPENILLDDNFNIKVTDFGFAAIIPEGQSACFTDLCGTPGYLAPEVLKINMYENQPPYGREVDLWACGVIMYTLLAGYPPFWHRRQMMMLRQIVEGQYNFSAPEWDDISEPPKELIRRFLTVKPADRISASEALQHPFFQIGTHVEQGVNARRRLKRTMLMVRCAVRVNRMLERKPQGKVQLSQLQRDPYRQRAIRKIIDAGAFKIYGHWVRKDEEQNRAVMFQNSIKLEMKRLMSPRKGDAAV